MQKIGSRRSCVRPEGALPSYGVSVDGTSGSAPLETLGVICQGCPVDFFAIFVGYPNRAPARLLGASVAPQFSCQLIGVRDCRIDRIESLAFTKSQHETSHPGWLTWPLARALCGS
jgi:hypothetical protein